MIKLTREPEGFGPPMERCCFCRRVTPFWYEPKDVPVCEDCSKNHSPKDVPSKEDWCAKEQEVLG